MLTEQERLEADLLAIDLARDHYDEFRRYVFKGWRDAAHLDLLGSYLQEVELYVSSGGQEGIGRLMVFMPPRHGKSLNVSTLFPAWFLGRNPNKRVIIASCNARLAFSFSRQARNLLAESRFRAVFGDLSAVDMPIGLADDSRSAEAWDIAGHQGGLVAAGVGGRVIGSGAHLGVIDDPIRSRKDAESKLVRDEMDSWYKSDFYTRLEDHAAVVLMHQRWHSDDQAGRLLRRMLDDPEADQWTILCLPALAEEWAGEVETEDVIKALQEGWFRSVDALGRQPGEALWPEKYPADVLRSIQVNAGGYEFDSMYQQRPRPIEGALIKANDIKKISLSELPDDLREVRYWDLAVSGRESADKICGARVGQDGRGAMYIRDVRVIDGPWTDARPKIVQVMLEDPASVTQGIEISGQQAGYYQGFKTDAKLQTRVIVPVNPREVGSKQVRANVWACRIPDGLVYMVIGPWNDGFVAECVAFPRGRRDDQVDGVSGAKQMLGGSGWTDWAREQLEKAKAMEAGNAA